MNPLPLAGALVMCAAQAQQFSCKDWTGACDNTRHCETAGFRAEDDTPAASLLGRDAGGNAPLLRAAGWPGPGGAATAEAMDPTFSEGKLRSFGKGRGVADCGTSYTWLWTADGFRLLEAGDAPLCRGMPGGGFPLRRWTARQQPG